MIKSKVSLLALVAAAAILMILLMAFGPQISKIVAGDNHVTPTERVIYYAHGNLDPNDNIPQKDKDSYFGFNAVTAGNEAIKQGIVKDLPEYIVNKGEGDLFTRMYHDPALCAAIALYLDQLKLTGDTPILAPEANLKVGERADAAHLRFLKNEQDWDDALARIKAILLADGVTYEVKELNSYASAMYMRPQALEGDKPRVVVQETHNEGGYFIVFHVVRADGTKVEVRFRLNCGYQPIDIPDWPVPTRTPKDPKDDLQNNPSAQNYDFYSPDRVNHDPDTTGTDEPVSPDEEYKAPTPPVIEITPAPTETPDYGDGDTVIVSGTPYVVETGDVDSLPALEDIADPSNPDKPQVDPAVAGDAPMTGDPAHE